MANACPGHHLVTNTALCITIFISTSLQKLELGKHISCIACVSMKIHNICAIILMKLSPDSISPSNFFLDMSIFAGRLYDVPLFTYFIPVYLCSVCVSSFKPFYAWATCVTCHPGVTICSAWWYGEQNTVKRVITKIFTFIFSHVVHIHRRWSDTCYLDSKLLPADREFGMNIWNRHLGWMNSPIIIQC